jgi:hypothetical protein
MSNGVHHFEEYLLPRLEATRSSEASEYVLREWRTTWEGDLGSAVIDAIEHLPARKTRMLRDWVTQVQNFSDWKTLEREGWTIDTFWPASKLPRVGDRFAILLPEGVYLEPISWVKFEGAIAAGAGASEIKYEGSNKRMWPGHIGYVFTVVSVL